MATTRDEIVQCYRAILDREPEDEIVIDELLGKNLSILDIVSAFRASSEYGINNHKLSLAKCNGPYLAKTLKTEQRSRCFIEHYHVLANTTAVATFGALMAGGTVPLDLPHLPSGCRVTVAVSREVVVEGELSIEFSRDGATLYNLSCTIVPGSVFEAGCRHALLVSRMQGKVGRQVEIYEVTKATREITPQAILFAVALGLACHWGAEVLLGVCATAQLSYGEDRGAQLAQVYDRFFESAGGAGPINGFYVCRLPIVPKPVSWIKPGHRLRTKRKRRIKEAIATAAAKSWSDLA